MKVIEEIQKQLELLYGKSNPLKPADFIIQTRDKNALVVSQNGDEADLAICLSEQLLRRFQNQTFPQDFDLSCFPDLSVIVEELSHFNFFCENAFKNQEVSPLELEVQGEVDKFGFALECLYARNEMFLADKIFESLFDNFKLGHWVSPDERERYQQAHEVARAFCRKVLDRAKSMSDKRELFRSFYEASFERKISNHI